jgi:hypothetical protein
VVRKVVVPKVVVPKVDGDPMDRPRARDVVPRGDEGVGLAMGHPATAAGVPRAAKAADRTVLRVIVVRMVHLGHRVRSDSSIASMRTKTAR